MSNRTLMWLTALVVLGMGVLLTLNLTRILMGHSDIPQVYLKFNEVRGMAVKHNGKLYTLNFNQQKNLINMINRMVPVIGIEEGQRTKPDIEEIVVYQFGNQEDITITPVTYVDNDLIVSMTKWNPRGYLLDVSDGELRNLLNSTHDP